MNYNEILEGLRKQLKAVNPDATLETGVFNNSGEMVMRLTVPGVKTIETSNITGLSILIKNLEDAARLKKRSV